MDVNKLEAQYCRLDFHYFLKLFWPVIISEPYVDNWHIKYLCEELQDIGYRIANREANPYDLVINVPPGTSKSTICTVMFPVWLWTLDSSIRALTGSYSSSLSMDHAVKSRDIIKSDNFIKLFPELTIRGDFDNKTHYKNKDGGERYATSVRGTVTGFHAHVIMIDDPLNPKEASSDVERKNANDFITNTLSTRKVDKAVTPTILIMQRLHEEDPTGLLLEQKKKGKAIKHICLPAETSPDIEPSHLREFYQDGVLDNQRLTKDVLNELKISLGSYGYAGQMMQTPSPLDGGIYKRDDFRTFKDIPRDEHGNSLLKYVGSDWDLAYTEKETNSASAYVTAGVYENKMYIIDLGFDYLEFPGLIKYMKSQQAPHYIEAKASGKSAKQTLTNQGIPAIEVKVDGGDKVARAMLVTPFIEAGMVLVQQSLLDKLLNDDKQGLLKFPNSQSDLPDAFAQSVSRLLNAPKVFTF